MTTRTGQCDCCGADSVELSFSVAYGIDTWSCADCCEADPASAPERAWHITERGRCSDCGTPLTDTEIDGGFCSRCEEADYTRDPVNQPGNIR